MQNCRIRVSPQKVERALSFDYPFFHWFPIIFADEITALPARKLDLAIGVSVGSSTQIALFVVPVARRILLILFFWKGMGWLKCTLKVEGL